MNIDHRSEEERCQCDFRTKVLGDGCRFCNPEMARAYADGQEAARQTFGNIGERLWREKNARR